MSDQIHVGSKSGEIPPFARFYARFSFPVFAVPATIPAVAGGGRQLAERGPRRRPAATAGVVMV